MARFLGDGSVIKSPRTTRTYTVSSADRWAASEKDIRPPPYIIGVGGFGVTYRVVDDRGALLAMKEYFPRDHARRTNDGRIVARQSEGGVAGRIFDEGLRRFVAEGQLLASFNHEGINRVLDAFDANNTSYQIVRLVEGREQLGDSDTGAARIERRVTLEDYLRELERPDSGVQIDLALIEPIVKQLLDAVEYIHTTGSRKAQEITGLTTKVLIHRDIKPSNILIEAPEDLRDAPAAEIMRDPRTRALLIDFGSARIFREGEESDVSRSIGVVTEGYAPPELSDNQLEQQGPHTDIYSLAAVIWRALLGRKPSVTALANGAKLADLATPVRGPDGKEAPRAPRTFLLAVDKALNAQISARPQSIADWRAQLFAADQKGADRRAKDKPGPAEAAPKPGRNSRAPLIIAAALVAAAAIGFWLYSLNGVERNIMAQAKAADDDVGKAMTAAGTASAKAAADAQSALPEIPPGFAAAKEGYDNHEAYKQFVAANNVHDSATSGSEQFGDKQGNAEVDGVSVSMWCHKKGPDVTPDSDYSSYTTDPANGVYPNATVGGEDGWACGIGHTHHRDYSGPQSPFEIARDQYEYWGGVSGALDSLSPSGPGQIKFQASGPFGEVETTGQFNQTAAALEISGQTVTGDETTTGKFRISNLSQSPLFEISGETRADDKPVFRGQQSHVAPNYKLSAWKGWEVRSNGDELQGVLDAHDGVILGALTRPNGDVWRGSIPALGAKHTEDGPTQSWGRLQNARGEYWGQIVDGRPDGCGVLRPNGGPKQVGYFHAGRKDPGAAPASCRREHYVRPFDPEG